MVQAGGDGVMVWGIFSWHTLGPLVPIEYRFNATAYLSIVADHSPQSPDLNPIEHCKQFITTSYVGLQFKIHV